MQPPKLQHAHLRGNVKEVVYQGGRDDQMHHRYSYDADNRIGEVETSADKVNWHTDADYFYYPHGPLERTELGEHKVQGVDYAYTLQGWLKGINGELLTPENDMGQDGKSGTANAQVGRDAFGMSLSYYGNTDYTAVNTARWDNSGQHRPFAPQGWGSGEQYAPLYNGNIASAVYTQQPQGLWGSAPEGDAMANIYHYDQLNRLTGMVTRSGITATGNDWTTIPAPTSLKAYMSRYSYDGNGNILTAQRYNRHGSLYDSLSYFYKKSGAQLLQNRLYHLQDHADPGNLLVNPGAGEEAKDLAYDNSTFANGTPEETEQDNNYRYDALGNLVKDRREGIDTIAWTVAGKVRKVLHGAGSGLDSVRFTYGADGQRVSKTVGNPYLPGGYREYYIRDAQGNIMATYRYTNNGPASLQVTERPLYGSSRVGSYAEAQQLLPATAVPANYAHPMLAARTHYELADHLGNVRATVSGQLLPSANPASAFEPHLLSEMAYEPFGALLPGRNYSSDSYRFGFQGQEKDNEVYGAEGTALSFTYRVHDARVGRFLSIDPLAAKYAYNSPYAFSENRVIDGFELEGLEFMKSNGMFTVGKGSRGIRRPFLPGYYKQLQLKTYEDVKYQVGQYFMQANTIGSGSPEEANGVVAKSTSSMAADMGAYLLQHSKAAAEDAIKQDDYVNQSLGLVASADQMGLIPDVFKGDETFQSDVASFLYDSSLPSGSDSKSQAYRSIVGILGKEIFDNRSEITKGSYQRDATIMSFDRPMGLDRPSLGPVVRGGHTEAALDRAITRFVDAPEGNFRKDKISKAE